MEMGDRLAHRWVIRILPVAGIAASASVNALATYLVGDRAHAYFSLGPDEVRDWRESLRAITGLDERQLNRWLRGSPALRAGWQAAQATGKAVAASARRLAQSARWRRKNLELSSPGQTGMH